MVFKSDFSFGPLPSTPTGYPRSRSVSPKASCGRTPYFEDGEISPSSKDPSVMSSWSSKRSSMTSINSSGGRDRHLSVSTVFAESVINSGPVISPIRIRFDSSYGFGDESDSEGWKKKGQYRASTIKTSIFRGFHQFPFHSNKTKKVGSAPASPTSPEALSIRTTSNKSCNQNTRATGNTRFRLFKSAPKSTKEDSRRPPPLNLQSPPKVSPSRAIKESKGAFLASPIKLETSTLAPKDYDFAKSPEAGVQLLFQTLSEESDQEDILGIDYTKGRNSRNHTHHKGVAPVYLENSSPWFISQGPPPPTGTTKAIAIRFPGSYYTRENIPKPSGFSPLSLERQHQPIAKPIPAPIISLLMPGSPIVQPPTPSSTGFTGSPKSFLFDEDEETDIEDSPADFYARRPSPATSRRSSLSVSRRSSISLSRRSSISRSRKSSTASFFCCGQRLSFDRHGSIGLGGLTGDEVEIKDDADSTFYPGINELKSKSSWLYNNPHENSSSDDEDDDDDDSEIEEAYQKHLSLITQIRNKSTSSLAVSTPELTMSSSVSSMSSCGQMLATPPTRRNRRRTASSECIVLEALEEMRGIGLGGVEKRKSGGLGFSEDVDLYSEWADVFWEMNSDEPAGWDWETQQMTLIGV